MSLFSSGSGSDSGLDPVPSQLCELSRLAWDGLEKSNVLFLEDKVPPVVLEFSVRTGLLSQVRVDSVLVLVLVLEVH